MWFGTYAELRNIVTECNKVDTQSPSQAGWTNMSEDELWEQLCLCILSSNVRYELAVSAFEHLKTNGFLSPLHIKGSRSSFAAISVELSKNQFLPYKRNGDQRKYRFPKTAAKYISHAAKALYVERNGLKNMLIEANCEEQARNRLAEAIPGVGMKQASHFLRNVGYSTSLAIVDTHVVRFLKTLGIRIPASRQITKSTYLELEALVRELCGLLGLDVSHFDRVLWRYMRGV